jgi:DNA-binding PucR family transcriptional regulator
MTGGVSFIYLRTEKAVEEEKVRKIIDKILSKAAFELEGKEGIYRLTIQAGQKGMALMQSSFAAAAEDLGSSFRGLIVPMFNDRFISFLTLVPDNSILYLFEAGHLHPEIFIESMDLLESIDIYTLMTVKAYIEAGNSPSLASLRLYVHRNTVTYRIDRFIQQTGIDLKPFPNSVFVYFLIEAKLGEIAQLDI